MKRVKRTASAIVLAIMICMMLFPTALAAGTGSVWLGISNSSTGTVAAIATDTTVTDGLVEIAYDSSKLTFVSVETDSDYVAMYAVNTDTKGVVKISWVAPGAYEADGTGICLIRVNFSGTEKSSTMTMTGTVNGADGSALTIGAGTDTTELKKAVLEAEALTGDVYTEESFAAMEQALAQAKAVLENPAASQSEVDDAVNALRQAMDALALKQTESGSAADTEELEKAIHKAEGLDKSNYTQKSYSALEKALKEAKKVLADSKATQEKVDKAAKALNDAIAALVLADTPSPDTGDDNSMTMLIVVAALCVVGIVVVVIVMKSKKGRYGK